MAYLTKVLEYLTKTVDYKSEHYKRQPVEYMPMEWLLAQVGIKAMRAYEVKTLKKREDDLKDLLVYAMYALARTQDEMEQELKPEGGKQYRWNGECVTQSDYDTLCRNALGIMRGDRK